MLIFINERTGIAFMKKLFLFLMAACILISLPACGKQPFTESTSAEPIVTLPNGTEQTTLAETSTVPIATARTIHPSLTMETRETAATTMIGATSVPIPEYFELPYTTKNLYMPISELYTVEHLQKRAGDGMRSSFALIARVFNSGETPIVVTGGTLTVDYGDSKSTGAKSITPFYVMPYQTGFVVLHSPFSPSDKFDVEDVDYTYSVRTAEPKLKTARYFAESATATVMHYGSTIGAISFDIMMKDPPSSRLVQADVVLWNEDGVAIDAFSQKVTHRDGRITFSYTPDFNITKDDIASYSFNLSTQCNE